MSRWVGVARPVASRTLAGASYDRRYGSYVRHRVGASLWQTPGGVQDELDSINTDFVLFMNEIKEYVFSHGYPDHPEPATKPVVDLYVGVWVPLLQQWTKFYADHKGWTDNFWWSHAPEAETFQGRLISVRESAKKLGMKVMTPDPQAYGKSVLFDPHHNVVDDAAEAARKTAADLMTIVKVGLVAALGIAGVSAALAVSRKSRGGY